MAGAEKLAAQTARSEFEQKQVETQTFLDAERKASAQAQTALDDIRATLERTFGGKVGIIETVENASETPTSETGDLFDQTQKDAQEANDDAPSDADDEFNDIVKPIAFSKPIAVPGIDVEPGIAFDVQDEMVTIFNEPEPDDIVIGTVGTNADRGETESLSGNIEDRNNSDPEHDVANQPVQLRSPTTPEESQFQPTPVMRPRSFYDERPDDVDNLQAIGGIDPRTRETLE